MALSTSIRISLKDDFTKHLKGMRGAVGGFGKHMKKSLDFAATMNHAAENFERFGSMGRSAIRGLVSESIDLENALARVGAKTGTTGTEAFKEIADQARDLGATTTFTALQVAEAQDFMAQAGLNTQEILAATPSMLNLSKVGALDLAEAADIATNVTSGMRMEIEDTQRVVDVLAKTSVSANTDVRQMGEAMKYAAPIAADAGVSVEQLGAMMGVLGNAGVQASMAGTSVRAILQRLVPTSKAARKQMKGLGIEVADSEGNLKDIGEILEQVQTRTSELTGIGRQNFLKQVFGDRAAGAASILLEATGSGELQRLASSLQNAEGEASRLADEMTGPTQKAILELESAWSGMKDQLAQEFLPVLVDLMEEIKPLIAEFSEWAKENPELVRSLAKAAVQTVALSTAAGPLIRALGVLRVGMAGPTGLASIAMKAGGALSGKTGLLANLGKAGLIGAVGAVSFQIGKWIAQLTGLDKVLADVIHGGDNYTDAEAERAAKINEAFTDAARLGVTDDLSEFAGGFSATDEGREMRTQRANEFADILSRAMESSDTRAGQIEALRQGLAEAENARAEQFRAAVEAPLLGPAGDILSGLQDAGVDVNVRVETDGGSRATVTSTRTRGAANVGEVPVGAF